MSLSQPTSNVVVTSEPDAALASLVDGELVDVDVDDVEVPDEVSASPEVDIEDPLLVELGGSTSPVEVVGAASPVHAAASTSAPLAAKARQTPLPQGARLNRTEAGMPIEVLQLAATREHAPRGWGGALSAQRTSHGRRFGQSATCWRLSGSLTLANASSSTVPTALNCGLTEHLSL